MGHEQVLGNVIYLSFLIKDHFGLMIFKVMYDCVRIIRVENSPTSRG